MTFQTVILAEVAAPRARSRSVARPHGAQARGTPARGDLPLLPDDLVSRLRGARPGAAGRATA